MQLCIAGLSPATAATEETLVFSRMAGELNDVAETILTEAYLHLKIRIKTISYPGERALVLANRGLEIDGEINRAAGMERDFPNLIMVPIAVSNTNAVVFSKNAHFKVAGWESLRPYKIGITIGVKVAERGTAGMNVEAVPSDEMNFVKLESGRIDVLVCDLLGGLKIIKEQKVKGIQLLEPPLLSVNSFHYLHKKHADLIPKITKVLRAMESSGRIREIYNDFVKHLKS